MAFPGLADRVGDVRARIAEAVRRGGHGQQVTIVAVTKTHGPEAARAAYEAGLHDVGENKVQEALKKIAAVDVPVRWHLIGHLQRNKVKALEQFVLLHSLDSPRLADAVCEFGVARGRAVDVLIELNLSGEATKGGYTLSELLPEAERLAALAAIRVRGVMTMASFTATESQLHRTFAEAREAREELMAAGHPAEELSMGMSNDYEIAVEEGATLVRIGTTLFGARAK
ncbi:MAG TPA: YggS family pyridoxal phosphate-dependent enzyme [Gemmatimonadaceae bacterium]|nr:YggS family pyridoxal phosphate-dependent enzyme [Gemmatimonadaceae bacterium]